MLCVIEYLHMRTRSETLHYLFYITAAHTLKNIYKKIMILHTQHVDMHAHKKFPILNTLSFLKLVSNSYKNNESLKQFKVTQPLYYET